MGYTTQFNGEIFVEPLLNKEEIDYLNKFSKSRRMDRVQGPYFVDGSASHTDPTINNYDKPPEGQPGLWCDWVPTSDGMAIIWNESEKFYSSLEWMGYLIDHFIGPNPIAKRVDPEGFSFLGGHTLNGEIYAVGDEDPGDLWKLVVKDSMVKYVQGVVKYED